MGGCICFKPQPAKIAENAKNAKAVIRMCLAGYAKGMGGVSL